MELTSMSKPILLRFVLLTGISLFSTYVTAANIQDRSDSLLLVLTSLKKNDSTKTRVYFEIGREYWFQRNFSEAVFHLNKSVQLAQKSNFHKHQSDAYNLLAHVYLRKEKYDSVFYFLQKALDEKNILYYPSIYETYSTLYCQLGDYPASLKYALKAIDGYEKNPEPEFKILAVYVYIKAGEILTRTGQTQRAMHYYTRAYQKAHAAGNHVALNTAILNMAHYYYLQHNLEKAKQLYDTVIVMGKNMINQENAMFCYEGLGNIAIKQQMPKEAIGFYRLALSYALQKELNAHAENFYMRMGSAFLLNNRIDSAGHYLQQALTLSKASKNYNNLSEVYLQLAHLQRKRNNYQNAFALFTIHAGYKDSILSIEKIRTINNLDVLHRTQQKENEILRLQKSEQEKNFTIRARNLYITIGIFLVLVLSVVVLFILYNYRNKHRLHSEKVKQMEQSQQVASLQSMINGQESERTRIARDLHDGLGGLFSTVKMLLSTLEHENENLKQNTLFKKSYSLVDAATVELRDIAHNMMPEVLTKLGLINAVKDLADTISAGKSLKVTVEVYGLNERLAADKEVIMFRIIQELLNNCIKHANATEVIIQFIKDENRLSVVVEDNGQGFNIEAKDNKIHSGIETIKNRVNYLKGTLTIDSQKGKGTSIMMDFLMNDW